MTRDKKQYVSYTIDLIQALDPEGRWRFLLKITREAQSNGRYLEQMLNWLDKSSESSYQRLPDKLEGHTKWYSTRTSPGCPLPNNFSCETGNRAKSVCLLHLQIIPSRKGLQVEQTGSEKIGCYSSTACASYICRNNQLHKYRIRTVEGQKAKAALGCRRKATTCKTLK